jgi:tRNA(Leu) C34 or U34 (ribose-2'-O)-methylase TrmL
MRSRTAAAALAGRVCCLPQMVNVFLFAPESFHNLCLIARTLEAFGHRRCAIFDPHRLVRDRYGKVRSRELRAVSAGAFEKISWFRLEQPERFLAEHAGRTVMTVLDSEAIPLSRFEFSANDLVVFGPEARGLPPAIAATSNVALTIPLSGATQSLNLSVAIGVVLFESQRQLGART